MKVKEFISTHWVSYADYDNKRSLPHIMDGLKTTQRKAIYTATTLPKNEKPMRVSQFAGKAAEFTVYHHGDASMISTVVGLAQDYPGSNNYPLLQKHGQFGSRLSNEAAAPRYIHVSLSKNWDLFFKPDDIDIVEYLYEDGDKIEPKFFIPIVPTILLNGSDGVGNGYRSKILNYSLKDVIKALEEIVKYGSVKTKLVPNIKNWKGTVERDDKQIIFKGLIQRINSNKIRITELPPCYDNEKYKNVLNCLIEDKIIKDYQNRSTEDQWDWVIDCPRETTSMTDHQLLEKFSLIWKTTENFVCWGVNENAPLTFESPEKLIEYWYEKRLYFYDLNIKNQLKNIEEKLINEYITIKFLKWCIKNDINKMTKTEFLERIMSEIEHLTEDMAKKFINFPIYKITKDEIEKHKNIIVELKSKIEELQNTKPLDLFLKNIQELKKSIP